MPLSLSEAAKATGTNRTTILRAIKAGKVSATKDVHGNWLIEPVELHRVYPPVQERTGWRAQCIAVPRADCRGRIVGTDRGAA